MLSQQAPFSHGRDPIRDRIVIVRHAATSWSKTRRHTGRTDIPLDDDGIADARALQGRLAGLLPERVFVSPLRRALATCELAGFGAHAEIDAELMEWDYGRYEGLTTPDIRVERPGWNVFADGCPDGEDAADVGRRADNVLERVAGGTSGTVVIFSHAHFLRVLAARWIGLDPSEGRRFSLDACSVSTLGYERDDRVILTWNT